MNRDRLVGILTMTIDNPQLHKKATAEVLAEYDRLTALNKQLQTALRDIVLQIMKEGWVSDTWEVLIDKAEAAIRAAEEKEHA